MKNIALLHYWLINMRGGENVFAELCNMFPEADVYTHAYNKSKMSPAITSHRVRETFIGHLPFARTSCQKYLPLMPLALKKLDLSKYSLIISSESGPAKGILKPAGAKHICYCHTPMRYLWDMYDDYYKSAGIAGKIAMRMFVEDLRKYDLWSAESVDCFVANSNYVAERIKRIYGRDPIVIHPPVDTAFFSAANEEKKNFYLYAGALVSYKRPDLVIDACTRMNKQLVVIGDGPERKKLEKRAGANVTFIGHCDKTLLRQYYAQASALLFPGVEDFGIVPLEAQAAGTPVIAYGAGGALETVMDRVTGLFFNSQSVEALCNAIEEFENLSFDQAILRKAPDKFSVDIFKKKFLALEIIQNFLKENS